MSEQLINEKLEIDTSTYKFLPFQYSDCAISRLKFKDVTYSYFYENFMLKNIPCLISNTSDLWECSKTWVRNDNTINLEYINNEYGHLTVPVADCNSTEFNSQCKQNMTVNEYVTYMKNDKNKLLYLKDWHLKRTRPDHNFYEVPQMFASDWLNEYSLDRNEDDFMFVYIGPKDSWTPLHVDVYSSYSWSVNVVGRKKWILFPPGEENKLKDSLGNLPLLFDSNTYKDVCYYEVIQEKGDAIFVPTGWHHQVVNVIDTISVNHNWINACNIQAVWYALQDCLKSVEHEIEEFKDTPEFPSQCQTILKSLFGMDYESFILFLNHIANKRLSQFKGETFLIFQKYILGKNLIAFDLKMINNVMEDIMRNPHFFETYLLSPLKHDFINIKKSINEVIN
ncbi:2-oxoglutarate and iron-dependent oxygenase JMJD4 [Plutella xylostella]|uniref:2-oxoglutarate and iron-dependent oxygenase JMJD4 n=1 Tax=Plutella xylostella TaxID=51655 RepID=UPI002032B442|nr:2-oxoglutarate and iron-dependent oxygenase JMJD4 [Plutella xylostella]